MTGNCKATQTDPQDCLTAVKIRLAELQRVLPELSARLATDEEEPKLFPIVPKENANCVGNPSKIIIGPNLTSIYQWAYRLIDWKCYTLATRGLLDAVFDKKTLATCNMSGIKHGPTGRQWAAANTLDPRKISDVIYLVRSKFNVSEAQIRRVITSKCSCTKRVRKTKK